MCTDRYMRGSGGYADAVSTEHADPGTVTRPATARGRRTREAIVDAAAELMQSRGIAATGVGDVLLASGTGKSQLYHYFRGKQDLVLAVIDRQLERVLAALRDLAGPGGDPAVWVEAMLVIHRGDGGPYSCPLGVFSGQVDADPVLREHHATAFLTWQHHLAEMIATARGRGFVAATGDPETLAAAVLATLQGGLMLARLHRDADVLEIALRAALDHLRVPPSGRP